MKKSRLFKNLVLLLVVIFSLIVIVGASAVAGYKFLPLYFINKQVSYLKSLNNLDYLDSQKKKLGANDWFCENVGWCKDGTVVFASVQTEHDSMMPGDLNVFYIPNTDEFYHTTVHMCAGWGEINKMRQPADAKEFRQTTKMFIE